MRRICGLYIQGGQRKKGKSYRITFQVSLHTHIVPHHVVGMALRNNVTHAQKHLPGQTEVQVVNPSEQTPPTEHPRWRPGRSRSSATYILRPNLGLSYNVLLKSKIHR